MIRSLLLVIALLVAAVPALADSERPVQFQGFGPRIGVSFDPNQLVFGGQGDFGDLFPQTTLMVPVVEVGLGDDVTVVSIGTDLLFRFRRSFGVWNPYTGAELALIFVDADRGGEDTDLALLGIFGIQKGIGDAGRFAAEVKFEIIDQAPDVKLTAIWTFGD